MAKAITSIAFLMRMVSDFAGTAAAVLPKGPLGQITSWAMNWVLQKQEKDCNGLA